MHTPDIPDQSDINCSSFENVKKTLASINKIYAQFLWQNCEYYINQVKVCKDFQNKKFVQWLKILFKYMIIET